MRAVFFLLSSTFSVACLLFSWTSFHTLKLIRLKTSLKLMSVSLLVKSAVSLHV